MTLKPPSGSNPATVWSTYEDRLNQLSVNVKAAPYNARGDGTTDDTTAIQAAIAAVSAAGGGTIHFPVGSYKCDAAPLNLESLENITLAGLSGGRDLANVGKSVLVFNVTGTTPRVNMKKARNIACRDLTFLNVNTTFTGHLVDCDNDGGTGATDTRQISFEHCGFYGGAVARSPASLVRIDHSHSFDFNRCGFYNAQLGIMGRSAGGYAIGVTITNCFFQNNVVGHLKNPGENWTVFGNRFEPLSNGAPGAIVRDVGVLWKALDFSGNWMGDVTETGNWIAFGGNGTTVMANRFGMEAGAGKTCNAISVGDNDCDGIVIVGNHFLGGTGGTYRAVQWNATIGHESPVLGPNHYSGLTVVQAGTVPDTEIMFGDTADSGIVLGGDVTMKRSAANVLRIGTGDAIQLGSGTSTGQYIEGWEQTADPAAPAGNAGRLFFKDNGAGKTQLAVRFATGVVQVIATEP